MAAIKIIKLYYNTMGMKAQTWLREHFGQVAVFNLVIVLLTLLRSAGYFHPFFPLTINMIVLTGLVLAVFLLGMNSRAAFVTALLFWITAAFLRISPMSFWAERVAVYAFEVLVIAVILLIFEIVRKRY